MGILKFLALVTSKVKLHKAFNLSSITLKHYCAPTAPDRHHSQTRRRKTLRDRRTNEHSVSLSPSKFTMVLLLIKSWAGAFTISQNS
jgi:hypothetical protein